MVGEDRLADVVQQPRRVHQALLARCRVRGTRDRLRIARHGGRVARRHAVAQRKRLDHREEDVDLDLAQALGALVRAL